MQFMQHMHTLTALIEDLQSGLPGESEPLEMENVCMP